MRLVHELLMLLMRVDIVGLELLGSVVLASSLAISDTLLGRWGPLIALRVSQSILLSNLVLLILELVVVVGDLVDEESFWLLFQLIVGSIQGYLVWLALRLLLLLFVMGRAS